MNFDLLAEEEAKDGSKFIHEHVATWLQRRTNANACKLLVCISCGFLDVSKACEHITETEQAEELR